MVFTLHCLPTMNNVLLLLLLLFFAVVGKKVKNNSHTVGTIFLFHMKMSFQHVGATPN